MKAYNGRGHGPHSRPVDVYVGEAGKHTHSLTHSLLTHLGLKHAGGGLDQFVNQL